MGRKKLAEGGGDPESVKEYFTIFVGSSERKEGQGPLGWRVIEEEAQEPKPKGKDTRCLMTRCSLQNWPILGGQDSSENGERKTGLPETIFTLLEDCIDQLIKCPGIDRVHPIFLKFQG